MKKKIIELLKSVKISFLASPFFCILKIVISLLFTFSGIFYSKILSNIISQFEVNNVVYKEIVILSLLLIFAYSFKKVLNPVDIYINDRYNENMMFFLEKNIIKKMRNIDQRYYEECSLNDKMKFIRSKYDDFADIGWNTLSLISDFISSIMLILVLIKINIGILIIAILALPILIFLSNYMVKKKNEHTNNVQKISKKILYYKGIIENKITNYETRMFNNKEFFYEKIETLESELSNKQFHFKNKESRSSDFVRFFGILIYIFSLIVFVQQYKIGTITIALISYYLGIITNFQDNLNLIFSDFNNFLYDVNNVSIVNDFFNENILYEKKGCLKQDKSIPKIEFKNVWFKYPNTNYYVLKDCSFTIEPGEKVALLGSNGSGKSTIIKLLLCFYKIERGSILLNDKNIYDYDFSTIRKKFAVLFQNYINYSLPFREIIALSNFNEINNDELIKQSCLKSGIFDLVSTWEKGIDTVIGIYYDDGIEMSGGQWQLTSLARTYFTNNKYYILDEPSASLDIYTEDKIFRNIYNEKGEVSSLIVSHMIANSKEADKIIILDNGKVCEIGNHNELFNKNGLYKKWYTSQYKRYIIENADE